MKTSTKWIIGLGVTAVAIGAVSLIIKHNKELKGEGEVTAETKKSNKIVFVKK